MLGHAKQAVEVLLGLADVLRHDAREIDAVGLEPEVVGDHLRGHRLARPGRAGEQRDKPAAAAGQRAEPPVVEHAVAVADEADDRAQRREVALGQHEVLPRPGRRQAQREIAKRSPRHLAPRGERVLRLRIGAAALARVCASERRRVGDLRGGQQEAVGDLVGRARRQVRRPQRAALVGRQLRHLDGVHRDHAEQRDVRVALADDDPRLVEALERGGEAGAVALGHARQVVDDEQRARQQRPHPGACEQLVVGDPRGADRDEPAAGGVREDLLGVGPDAGQHARRAAGEQAREALAHARSPRVGPAQLRRRAGPRAARRRQATLRAGARRAARRRRASARRPARAGRRRSFAARRSAAAAHRPRAARGAFPATPPGPRAGGRAAAGWAGGA